MKLGCIIITFLKLTFLTNITHLIHFYACCQKCNLYFMTFEKLQRVLINGSLIYTQIKYKFGSCCVKAYLFETNNPIHQKNTYILGSITFPFRKFSFDLAIDVQIKLFLLVSAEFNLSGFPRDYRNCFDINPTFY